jgi:CubicO group peptidase (beta-lactamase class C family)
LLVLPLLLGVFPLSSSGQVPDSAPDAAGPPTRLEQPSPGPPTTATEFFQRVHRIREYLQEFVDTSAVPGVSLALGVGDRFTRFEAFGYADLENGRPVTPHTRFRIGSISKTLTAAALTGMVQDGAIDLDATVQTYVPEFPEKEDPVTLRQLAYHLSGIRHYRGDEALSNRPFDTVLEALSVFREDPLVTRPGSAYSYSTYGYTLLSAAMERASGMPFLDLMEEEVFRPLRMIQTGPEVKSHLHPEQATGYEPDYQGGAELAWETDLSNKWAGGGYVSTAGDLLKFARAHLGEGFLRPEALDLLWSPPTLPDGTSSPMGMGWQAPQRASDGKEVVAAGGNAIGGLTVLIVIPEDEVVVVFMTNMGNAPIGRVPVGVLRLLLGIGDPDQPSSPSTIGGGS